MRTVVTTLDFETEGIEGNPLITPPRPVGLAVRWDDDKCEYITDLQEMRNVWGKARNAGDMLFHNAPFDLSVAKVHLGMDFPHWKKVHDTM